MIEKGGKIVAYYDGALRRKVRDIVFGNRRVELACRFVRQSLPASYRRMNLLEVGCGTGYASFQLANYYFRSNVRGVDISGASILFAQTVFSNKRLSFEVMSSLSDDMKPMVKYDLILLMDVYEHMPVEDRSHFYELVRRMLRETGLLVLTVPSPEHLRWLARNRPEELQPVDLEIDDEALLELASQTRLQLLCRNYVSVWMKDDYVHCLFGRAGHTLGEKRSVVSSLVNRLAWFRCRTAVKMCRWKCSRYLRRGIEKKYETSSNKY